MPLTRVKVWNAGDVLTAADLNAEFNNIVNNVIATIPAGVTANAFTYWDLNKILGTTAQATNGTILIGSTAAAPVLATITGTTAQIAVTNGAGSITISTVGPYTPATFTQYGLLYGNAANSILALAAATNGQIPIGSTGIAPIVTTITGTANQLTVTNGAGSITLSLTGPYSPSTFTSNGVLIGHTTSAINSTAEGATGTVLRGVTGSNPVFGAVVLTTDVSGILPTANGGTASAFFTVAGPSVARTYTFPDAAATVLTTNAAVTVAQGGSGAATFTANALLAGNTTSPFQTLAAVGTTGQGLKAVTSSLPVWRNTFPTIQVFTSGAAQTYTTPANAIAIIVEMVGGGGGGAGSGTSPGAATGGVASTWSGGSLSAGGGALGTTGGGAAAGGASSNGDLNITGEQGGPSIGTANLAGGKGGASLFGFGGPGGPNGANNGSAGAVYGGGGGGAGDAATANSGGGGGGGGYVRKIISSPSATYTYTVGTAGTGGTLGTGGAAGGNGAAGLIFVTEYY